MKFISKFLGGLLVLAITATSLAFVLDSTILSADYLNSKAGEVELYKSLADELPVLVASDLSAQNEVKAVLSGVLTTEFLEVKISSFLDHIEAYYKEDAPTPSLDLTILADQLKTYGVAVPTESPLAAPIKYRPPSGLDQTIKNVLAAKTWGIVAILVLLLTLWLVSRGWGKYGVLAKTFAAAALVQGFLFLLTYGLPQITQMLVGSIGGASDNLTPMALNFSKAVGEDVGQTFLQIGAGLIAAAVGMIVLGLIAKLAARASEKSSKKTEAHTPKPDRPKIS